MTALDPLDIAVELMRADSTSGREGEVIAVAERLLRGHGWATQRIPVTAGRDALFASAEGATDAPFVTLSTHLDTVPPYIPPRVEGGRLRGRGSCDAKGIAAAQICAAARLRDKGVPVALLFVVGEETVHDGAHAANAWVRARGLTSVALVNGEPTESTVGLGTKGALRLFVRTAGRAAHSAYPHLGHSATRDLVQLLAGLDSLELPTDALLGETTVNIGTLSGGVADNVIAPSAEARLMIRLVSPMEGVVERLRRWVNGRAELEVYSSVPAVRLGAVDGFPTSVVAYATDIPELSNWGTPYLFGPGSIHVAHTPDEYIEIEEMRAAVGAYAEIARRALAAHGGGVRRGPAMGEQRDEGMKG